MEHKTLATRLLGLQVTTNEEPLRILLQFRDSQYHITKATLYMWPVC